MNIVTPTVEARDKFRRVHSEVKPLTRELAQKYHEMEASPTERELKPGRVKHLQQKIEAGHAVAFHWASAQLKDVGKNLRMNGNHSSTALLGLNGTFPDNLIAHIDEYEVDHLEGLAQLFRQFDDRASGRSSKDVCGAYQGLYEDLRGVPVDIAKLAVEGVNWARKFFDNPEGLPDYKGDDVGILFGETTLHSFVRWVGLDIFSSKTPELKRREIVAAMYVTFKAENLQDEAREFWIEVARGGKEFEPKAPSTILDGELKEFYETKEGCGDQKPANFFNGCLFGWTAHRRDKQIDRIDWSLSKGFQKVK